MWGRVDGLRVLELGTPGEMHRRLTELTLTGKKRATAGLLELDYHAEDEPLERVGERLALVDDSGAKAAELEVVDVQVVPFGEVTWEFAQAEGEGFRSVEHWREVHRRFWASEGYEVDDSSQVVCVHYRVAPYSA
ncbi:ASCH domain-containing protein [Nonomuraea rhodomycinica]|uniref:ASCH domain-containing protein n=1 Tax=Nonomuraea rhodomycinica TaxID=1712872 RepID=A0A7Y6MAB8_9ACTN|nr:ASCH domain-containing protein [Nonomuraea rhodomycinica]NUW40487.1 ASCH domain-containing protein [Nonomuraea rhodomycinica]